MSKTNLTLGSLFDGSGGFPLAGLISGINPVFASEIEPFPIRVTTKRMPWIKHYGDISQMNGGEIEPVDIITFGSPCFPAGTLVLTSKGLVEIEKIRVGDLVLTHMGRWRKVTAVGAKKAPTIRLKGNHCGLECTPNHPIYSFDGKQYSWIPAEDMLGKLWCVPTSMDYLPPPRPLVYENKHVKPLPKFSQGFFYFIGRWLGGGCVKVRCNSRVLCGFLTENFGKYAHGKEIPTWVLSLPYEFKAVLLQGILDSCRYRKPQSFRVTTTSKKLAFGIRLLAESLGKETTIYYVERPSEHTIQGRRVNQRNNYIVEIQDRNTHCEDGLHRWYRVKSIAAASEKTTVYNLSVDEDNSYTADGIVVHNCQDMSIAGKRAGLEGARSGLFHEAIRVITEMRKATNGKYPRYIVWENVPGAFSSNGGEDFQCVLESICRVKDEQLSVPRPPKWPYAGEILGEGFSVAWRLLDAQYWGVPQRRKRIYLVADFDGGRAGEILFESEGLSGYTPQGFRTWEGITGNPQDCSREAGCFGVDGYNSAVSELASTLGVNCGVSTGRNGLLVLNDQGGNRMDVTEEKTMTLRAEAHHPPCIIESAGFCTEHSAKSRSIGYEEEVSPTLRADVVPAAIALENHSADSRVGISADGKVQTLTSRMGTGGNNVPLLLKIRCGKEGGGKGPLIQDNKSATLSCNNDQTLFEPKVYGICSKDSNSMKSDNPNSGFYEASTTRCLDANGGNPSCNQGGMAVVALSDKSAALTAMDGPKGPHSQQLCNPTESFVLETVALEGNGSRPSHHGDGYSKDDVSFTLNATEQHGVAYSMTTGSFMQCNKEKASTLAARDYKDPPLVNDKPYGFYPQMKAECVCMTEDKSGCLVNGTNPGYQNGIIGADYIVRRLTPTECARLQGFPDWWCSDLGTEQPTDEELEQWQQIFETHRKITGTSQKPKSTRQLLDFLKNPHSDSAEYKMWGNGIALPCAVFVLSGIVWASQND